jgi:ribonuclease H / adenosylcobalamin/alpha-ribazole phosphatase
VRLYLVRHGAPDERAAGRCCGRTDVELSAAGRREAVRLAAAFADAGVAAVYASPLRRAVATAEPIAAAAGCDVTLCAGLVEIDFGAFEGRTFDELAAAEPELYERWMAAPAAVRFPGGESYADVRARAVAAAEAIARRHLDGAAVAVAHAGPIRAILAAALRMPDDAIFRLGVPYASIAVVEWTAGGPIVGGLDVLGGLRPIA